MSQEAQTYADKQKLLQTKIEEYVGENNYQVSQTPYFISSERYEKLANHCELLLSCFEKFLRCYVNSLEVQNLFPELEKSRDMTCIHPRSKHWIHIARFDLIETEAGQFKILEVNPGAPAITAPSLLAQSVPCIGLTSPNNTIELACSNSNYFPQSLIELSVEVLGKSSPNIAIVTSRIRPFSPISLLAKCLLQNGLNCVKINMQDLEQGADGKVYAGDMPIDIVFNKFDEDTDNTGQGTCNLYESSEDEIRVYLDGIRQQKFVVANNISSYLVVGNKKTIAMLSRPEFQYLFTSEEQEAIKEMVPETYCFDETTKPKFENMVEDFLTNKSNWVIKEAVNARSRAVWIGKECTTKFWNDLVQKLRNGPYVIQRFVSQIPNPVLTAAKQPVLKQMYTVVSVYVVRGKASGLLCRSSEKLLIGGYTQSYLRHPLVLSK